MIGLFTPGTALESASCSNASPSTHACPYALPLKLNASGSSPNSGRPSVNAQVVILDRYGRDVTVDVTLRVPGGEQLNEPVERYGLIMTNSETEIRQAVGCWIERRRAAMTPASAPICRRPL